MPKKQRYQQCKWVIDFRRPSKVLHGWVVVVAEEWPAEVLEVKENRSRSAMKMSTSGVYLHGRTKSGIL